MMQFGYPYCGVAARESLGAIVKSNPYLIAVDFE
jgi:hypothetical protein